MRVIVVGDVHGCLDELEKLLVAVNYTSSDRLVFLGDLLDRGPNGDGVVRLVRQLGARCVMGNHENKHLRWRKHELKKGAKPSYTNPMRPMRNADADAHARLTDDDFEWLASLPLTLDLGQCGDVPGNWVAVHAGFEPALARDKQRADKVIRVRYVDGEGTMLSINNDVDQPEGSVRWATVWKEPEHVVYGHHVMTLGKVQRDDYVDSSGLGWQRLGIDTGCAFGGSLTAVVLGTDTVVSVPAARAYAELWKGGE